MSIEIPQYLVERIQKACQGFDVPETKKEMEDLVWSVLYKWVENQETP